MTGALWLTVAVVFLVQTGNIVNSQRTKDRMYIPLHGASCFRRQNGTHTTGCSSKFGGSTGVLHVVRTVDDFAFLHAATPPPAPPYAVVIPTTLFTRANIMPLQLSPHVGGILLVRNTTAPDPVHYTHELQCPNQYSAYNAESCAAPNRTAQPDDAEVWNPDGTGMLHETFPFPIYYLDDEPQIRTVIECYERFNAAEPGAQAQRSLCSVQIDQFMASAVNSETCLRRSGYELTMKPTHYCDALMGKNVFATLFPRDTRSEQPATAGDPPATEAAAPAAAAAPEQFILVTARLDTASMFDGLGAGASEVLPFVALLSAAHTLATLLPERLAAAGAAPVALQPNVLFMIFNGEAYDYIGSQRFVYDLRRGNFPPAYQHRAVIRPEAVQLVIDVAGLDAGNASALHAYHVRDFPRATQLLSALDKYNSALGLGVATVDRRQAAMPAPSSVHSFLRDNATWPTVVLRAPTRNRYLHSVYDAGAAVRFAYANTSADFERLDDVRVAPAAFAADSVQMGVRNVSTLLALTLYELVTGRPNDGWLGANAVLVDELLYCYLNATRCRLMIAAVAPSLGAQMVGSAPVPPLRYISVQAYASEAVSLTYALLGLLVGRRTNETEARCKELPSLQWMGGANGTGECRLGTQNLSAAISPAFTMADYDFASGRYSTWTESTWGALSARIFLKPSAAHEAFTLAVGFVVMTLSFVIVFLVNSRSDVLFGDGSGIGSGMAASMVSTRAAAGVAANAPAQC